MHCVGAVYRMILKYYLNTDITWEQIDSMAKSVPGKGTWTFPLSTAATMLGIKITNIEITDYAKLYREGVRYLKKVVGEQSTEYYLEKSNIREVLPLIPEFLKNVPHETRKGTVKDILTALKNGKLVGAEINASQLNHTPGHALHFVLLYDADKSHLTFHDPGLPPKPGRVVTIDEFSRCFAYTGAGQEIDIFSL